MEPPVRTYSPEWHELRKTRLGASDVGALLGVSPWDTPADVWTSKRGAGRPQPDGSINTPIWWGHQEEPHIIEAAVHELVGDFPPACILTGWSWAVKGFMVSPDAIFTEVERDENTILDEQTGLIEAKVVGLRSGYLWMHGPPLHVLSQLHAQMAVTGSSMGHVAARIAGAPVKVWSIPRNEEASRNILEIVDMFWSYPEIPPHWEMLTEKTITSMQ